MPLFRAIPIPLVFGLMLVAALPACESSERAIIDAITVDQRFTLGGLQKETHIVRTDDGAPHVYASSSHDAAFALGFATARDRFFAIDLARRLGSGRLAERYGESALRWDIGARITGIAHLAERIDAQLPPALAARFAAYSDGVNAFTSAVRAGAMPVPTELAALADLLGADVNDWLEPFTTRDVASIAALNVYQSSFSDDDVRRAAAAARIPTAVSAGAPDGELRRAGLLHDIWSPVAPLFPVASAPGIGISTGGSLTVQRTPTRPRPARSTAGASAARGLVERAALGLRRLAVGLHRDRTAGYGSNAWAVAGDATAAGAAILAGDAHLPLSVPSVLYAYALDIDSDAEEPVREIGLGFAGVPILRFGTNGKVAFSQTQLGEDVTDWFAERVQLDGDGNPSATFFDNAWRPVTRTAEVVHVGGSPRLGLPPRDESWSRFQTFDGRWLTDFEGRTAAPDAILPPGQVRVQGLSGAVVPADTDGDGVVSALSFSYAGLDATTTIAAQDAMARASDLASFAAATRGLVGSSQASVVADASGGIAYTSYQAMPCRADLPRNPDATFQAGADPSLVLDGTRHGAWHIAVRDGVVDEHDASACVVPFDKMPQSFSPSSQIALAANNDPAGLSFDGSIVDDEIYLGGPWDLGFRADTIQRRLLDDIRTGRANVSSSAALQADVRSRQAELMVPSILGTLQRARTATSDEGGARARIAARYASDGAALDDVAARLARWQAHGLRASSGVRTFYEVPDDLERDDAVSTMIFNAWLVALDARVLGDERIDDIVDALGPSGRTRTLVALLAGRGPGGQTRLASWEASRQESVFFDDVRTDVVETADEEILLALGDALANLRAAPRGAGLGGFGNDDMTTWLWGLRHQARLQSTLLTYAADPLYTVFTELLQIDTKRLPLLPAGSTPTPGDPRLALTGFPRGGDAYAVDAADPADAASGNYAYRSGPAMRMIVQISSRGVSGRSVLPGGESSDPRSPHFADQTASWLGDRGFPIRFSPADVAHGSTEHEVLSPSAL